DVFAGKKSAQIREILISESAWEEMTCLFAPSLVKLYDSLEGQSTATRWPGKITQANIDFEASCLLEKLGERRDGIVGAKLYLGLSPR
ncbi:hypothetical protein JNS41_27970, partial [Klebsiella pneumoniae]|nr:hypothetical protein [Klebsiella pneumoniae]